jgi:glutamyl-tRNA synthetase
MTDDIRVRLAPSPTGPLHIGTARTALFNYLYAKKYDGKFVLRLEDTDKARSKEEYELDIMNGLSWLGLGWDEGPETPDLYGPYRQSERLGIYKKFTEQLLADKKAYYCYCTEEELEKERKEQETKKQAPKYSGHCRNLSSEDIEKYKKEGKKPAIRFIVEPKKIKFKDLIHGEMEFDSKLFGDFIIVKSDGTPVFMFAGVIDDAEMKISHVIRGDDHLSNTPKQILLAGALSLPIPEYGHIPLILNLDRTKLSKRKNPVSVTADFRDKGYLPEALVNFMAFLSWTPNPSDGGESEFFSLDELVDEFDLADVNISPAIFDQQKLDYLNGYYIRQLPLGELAKRSLPYLQKAHLVKKEGENILNALGLVQERMKKLSEAAELTEFMLRKPTYQADLLIAKGSDKETTIKGLTEALKVLEKETDFTRDSVEQLLRALASKLEIAAGKILWPIRVALSGRPASPGVFELIEYFGKTETLARIKTAIDMLK